jgi:dTDP-4-dehydrorhamnose reductase
MTTWLITGFGGMLGRDLADLLTSQGERIVGYARAGLDITDPAAVQAALERDRPQVVVNCAAWTAVDDAEAHEDSALAVNGHAVGYLAAACAARDAALVQVSTDYVFDGQAAKPYPEDHPAAPRSAYGRTKLAGERAALATLPDAVYIVRTAWLYGAHGRNFVATMLGRARAGQPSSVVDDQRGQPTWTSDVASQIHALIATGAPTGTYHATSSGETTWYGLAREVYARAGADPALVTPTTTEAFPRPAPRPAYSVLGHSAWAAAGIQPIGDWLDALDRAFPAIAATALAGLAAKLPGVRRAALVLRQLARAQCLVQRRCLRILGRQDRPAVDTV